MLLCECVRVYCFFTVLPVYVLLCAAYGVIKNDDDDDDDDDDSPDPNPNHITKQHAIVNIQQNIVICPTYPD